MVATLEAILDFAQNLDLPDKYRNQTVCDRRFGATYFEMLRIKLYIEILYRIYRVSQKFVPLFYFRSLYFSTIGLGKQIMSTKVVSFNIMHYFPTFCTIF